MEKEVIKIEKDIMGLALSNFKNGVGEPTLKVYCDKAEDETYDLNYFFRDFEAMPETEKKALDYVKGSVLDVGCGTGIHAKILQDRNLDIQAIDISPYAVRLAKESGLKNVGCVNFYALENQKFDTLLFLMNGIGLVETLDGFTAFFKKCDALLNEGGQIIFDSSDLIYLLEDEEGSYKVNLNAPYYGELQFQVEYENNKGEPFPWLFIDFENLAFYADKNGFKADLLYEDEHYNYLGRLSRK